MSNSLSSCYSIALSTRLLLHYSAMSHYLPSRYCTLPRDSLDFTKSSATGPTSCTPAHQQCHLGVCWFVFPSRVPLSTSTLMCSTHCWPLKMEISQDRDMSTPHLPRCDSNSTFAPHANYYIYRNATNSRSQKCRTVYKAAIALFCNVAESTRLIKNIAPSTQPL